jgi:hypothetical protein
VQDKRRTIIPWTLFNHQDSGGRGWAGSTD